MDQKRIKLYMKLYEYLLILRKPFADFILKYMNKTYPENWLELYVLPNINESYKKEINDLDLYDLLNILINFWEPLYKSIKNSNDYYVYNDDKKIIYDMLFLRNVTAHANENNIFVNNMYKHFNTLLKFSEFIDAYEYIIIKLKSDISKFKKEIKNDEDNKKEKLLDAIIYDVLVAAWVNEDLNGEVRQSIFNTIFELQNMKTADEIYDFYCGALKSTKGSLMYKNLKEKQLKTFEDIREKVNLIMNA